MFDNKWQKKEMPLVSLIGMGGGIASPAFLASIVLNILKPTVFSPVDDTGAPDFDYTAESSAITDISTSDVLGGVGFSADIWTGDGNSNGQKITTGVDLLTDGGMVWIKARDRSSGDVYSRHYIWDTERGSTNTSFLSPDVEDAEGQTGDKGGKIGILSDGFTAGGPGAQNNETYVGWSFRRAPGFFDIVTYNGDGGVQNVSHNLGQAPGILIVKSTSHDGYGWYVYHHSVENAEGKYGILHGGDQFNSNIMWNNTAPTDSVFTVTGNSTNKSGVSYVAYLFADNPSQNIACGSYTESTTRQEVNIGFKPEFLLYKGETYSNWRLIDTTRGFSSDSPARTLEADNAEAEKNENAFFLRDNGFSAPSSWFGNGAKILYMAIGSPNFNVPATQLTLTDTTVSKVSDGSLIGGTSIDQVLTVGETVQADTAISSTVTVPVFSVTTYNGDFSAQTIDSGIDNSDKSLVWIKSRSGDGYPHMLFDTERGATNVLNSDTYSPQTENWMASLTGFTNSGFELGYPEPNVNLQGQTYVAWNFRAAPGFFDIQTYVGISEGAANQGQTISHNLGSEPGMIVVKNLDAGDSWFVYHKDLPDRTWIRLNETWAKSGPLDGVFPPTQTSTEFNIGADMSINRLNDNYVAYLFADTPGLIKCGKTSNLPGATTEEVVCGFKPKFVMAKCITETGHWVMVDVERGLHPQHQDASYLYANDNDQEGSSYETINMNANEDGFILKATNGAGEYIYIAIAESAETDVIENIYASGTVSASTGNTITLSDASGTWSTGMKVQGTDSDAKDNPDAIRIEDVSLTSSAPTAEKNVNTWGDAVWEIATDENFTQNVQTATTALSATGTQAGPSFTLERETGYYTRTKYTALGQESEWSDVTYFVTKGLPVYADDVFSTYLYEGNADTSGSQTINNGIDLAGEGGFVWIKRRTAGSHTLYDTERGATQALYTTPDVESARPGGLTSFNNNGFTVGNYTDENAEGQNVVAWTFRKAPGFLDIVTYTGNSTAGHTISHSLGSVPGMIMIKNTSNYEQWQVWHRSVTGNLELDNTGAANTSSVRVDSVTSTSFNLTSGWNTSNADGQTYVAYIFAHDDARFGTNSDEAIIKCGSFTTGSSSDATIDLGWEPQWVMYKRANAGGENWQILDAMRGWNVNTSGMQELHANASSAETTNNGTKPTSTGFKLDGGHNNNATYIYVAIRRPHKPATIATDVFDVGLRAGSSSDAKTNSSILTDMTFVLRRDSSSEYNGIATRLMGDYTSKMNSDSPPSSGWLDSTAPWANMTGAMINGGNGAANTGNLIDYSFKRSPGFFDAVVYTGDGNSPRSIPHNLGVEPEMMWVKNTTQYTSGRDWMVYMAGATGTNQTYVGNVFDQTHRAYLSLNKTDGVGFNGQNWKGVAPTSTHFTVGSGVYTNESSRDHVAYLFASQPGISKVGWYVGSAGSNIDVDCGFTAGSRFVMIKRLDAHSDWYVWDTARGISSGNEYYMKTNTTDQEFSGDDYIDPLNAGFTVTSSAPADLNQNGGQYLFLAIA